MICYSTSCYVCAFSFSRVLLCILSFLLLPLDRFTRMFRGGNKTEEERNNLLSSEMEQWQSHTYSFLDDDNEVARLESQLGDYGAFGGSTYMDNLLEANAVGRLCDPELDLAYHVDTDNGDSDIENVVSSLMEPLQQQQKSLGWDGMFKPPAGLFPIQSETTPRFSSETVRTNTEMESFEIQKTKDEDSVTDMTQNYLSIPAPAYMNERRITNKVLPLSQATAPANPMSPSCRQRRKAALQNRLVDFPSAATTDTEESEDSGLISKAKDFHEDVKPDMLALAINNGQRRTRKRTASNKRLAGSDNNENPMCNDSSQFEDSLRLALPQSCSRRKLRKYELPDNNDPTVKNAKAAKQNRDRKKQELVDLKAENMTLRVVNDQLYGEYKKEKERRLRAENALTNEQEKRNKSTGFSNQCSNMKDVLEGVVTGLNQKFLKLFKVKADNRFATIPATVLDSGRVLASPPRKLLKTSTGRSEVDSEETDSADSPPGSIFHPDDGYNQMTSNADHDSANNAEIPASGFIPFEVDSEIGVVKIKLPNNWTN